MARTVPVMGLAVPGAYETAAFWNAQVKAATEFLLNPPRFKAYSSATITVPTGSASATAVGLDTEVYDSDGGHSTTTNTSQYVVQVAGTYLAIASVSFAVNSTGNRHLQINVNSGYQPGSVYTAPTSPANTWSGGISTHLTLAVGDIVAIGVWQTSGADLTLTGGATFGPNLSLLWISP